MQPDVSSFEEYSLHSIGPPRTDTFSVETCDVQVSRKVLDIFLGNAVYRINF